mgnify:CR=1 FL=1
MKDWILIGIALAALAVAIGAFGAHGIKDRVSEGDLGIFETGVKYQFYHALGLIIIGILGYHFDPSILKLPSSLMFAGIIIFSGSLYILVLSGQRWLGAITPIGGTFFIVSWILLLIRLRGA